MGEMSERGDVRRMLLLRDWGLSDFPSRVLRKGEAAWAPSNDLGTTQREAIAEAIRSQTTEATWYLRSEKAAEKVAVLVEAWLAEAVQAERERIKAGLAALADEPTESGQRLNVEMADVLAAVSRDTRSSSDE